MAYTDPKKKKQTTIQTASGSKDATQEGQEFVYKPYKPSSAVTTAKSALDTHTAQKPQPYQSRWQTQQDQIMDKILNREGFKYDLNGDALYQQYKDDHVQQGRTAMMDTMGQAAALTGGYGSSYAQMVGQQAYQGHLQQLGDKIPELYQLARDMYDREGQELYDQYGLLGSREDQDYGRYRDTVSDYNTERDWLADDYRWQSDKDYQRYNDSYDRSYGQHRDAVSDRQWQDSFDYQKDRDEESDRQWQEGFDYQKDRDAVADKQWQDTFDYEKDRDAVADDQWERNFGYQKERDAVADDQWERNFGYQKERDAVSDDQWERDFKYQKGRDAVADDQWERTFGYQQQRDSVEDRQWQDSFDYQKDRDAVEDKQWQDSFDYEKGRDAESDRQWRESFDYQKSRDSVSDRQWREEMDESKRQYDERRTEGTGDEPDGSGVATDTPGATSKPAKGTASESAGYKKVKTKLEDGQLKFAANGSLAAYLDSAVSRGELTEDEADSLYEAYYIKPHGGAGGKY